MLVPINKVVKNIVALRAVNTDLPAYQQMKESIRLHGIMSPISVRQENDPESGEPVFVIVDGLHRYTAATELGFNEIPVYVLSNVTSTKQLILQLTANLQKVETKPAEYGKQLRRILDENPSMTQSELASTVGVTPQWLTQLLKLATIAPNFAKAVDNGLINLSTALIMSNLPVAVQDEWVERAINTPAKQFAEECNAAIREYRDAVRQGRAANKDTAFEARAVFRKMVEVKNEIASGEAAATYCRNEQEIAGWKAALEWVLQVDDVTVGLKKEAFEARKRQQEEEKARREEERRAAREAKAREAGLI